MIDEMLFAGYLRKRPVELVKCVTNDIYVPAHAEFILEGYVDLDERRVEGPFGDHTGYYSLADEYPVFHLEKITRKKNPVYPTTIVGKPPMEDCYLGKATERIFRPLMKIQCPEMLDMDMPLEGVFHNCAIVSVKKAFPRHANKLLYALWGLGQMMYTKMIIVVDADVDVHNYAAVSEAVLKNVTCPNHLILTEGPLDALDHSSNRAFQGFRLGIDATTKRSDESCDDFLQGVSLLDVQRFDKNEKGCHIHAHFSALMHDADFKPNIVVVVDPHIDPTDFSTVAWKVFNNIDPNRDMVIGKNTEGRLFIGIDATKKGPEDGLMRPWPDDIVMDDATIAHVTERWSTYGIDR
jgi:4-hydroxy-3-polyprenylbenzoate decarboxylase